MSTQQPWGVYSPTHELADWERYDCHAVDMDDLTPDEDDVPALSQGSSNSGGASPKRRKRRVEWEEEEGEEDSNDESVFRLPSSFRQERVMAMPKGRRTKISGGKQQGKVFGTSNDFEDAEFLDYGGLEREVEMGGV